MTIKFYLSRTRIVTYQRYVPNVITFVIGMHTPSSTFQVPIHPTDPRKLKSDIPYFRPLSGTSKTKPSIDSSFLRQLRAVLFRIAFPSWRSKECLIVVLHSFFLVLRTVLSVGVARLDGRIVRDLVSGWFRVLIFISLFLDRLVYFVCLLAKIDN